MAQKQASNALMKLEIIVTSLVLMLVVLSMTGQMPDDRRSVYDTVPEEGGPFPYFSRVIFDDPSPLDAAILGSSLELVGLSPEIIVREASREIGRPYKLALLASNWRGEDLLYFLARDLLEHRKVGTLIIGVPHYGATRSVPHPLASYWWPLKNVSWNSDAAIIALAAAGLPRRAILKQLPPVRIRPSLNHEFDGGIDIAAGFIGRPFVKIDDAATSSTLPASSTFHLLKSAEIVHTGVQLNEFQLHYLHKILELAAHHDTRVAFLQIPIHETHLSRHIQARSNILEVAPEQTPYLAVVPTTLWSVRPKDTIVEQYYYDDHLNQNGRAYFSHQIASAFTRLLDGRSAGK